MPQITNYEIIIMEKEYAESLAHKYAEADDVLMTQFYMNAALGFKQRAESLELSGIVNLCSQNI